jgi:hypothetical protein
MLLGRRHRPQCSLQPWATAHEALANQHHLRMLEAEKAGRKVAIYRSPPTEMPDAQVS